MSAFFTLVPPNIAGAVPGAAIPTDVIANTNTFYIEQQYGPLSPRLVMNSSDPWSYSYMSYTAQDSSGYD